MPTLTSHTLQGLPKTLYPTGSDKAIAWLSQIMAAAAGTSSGEDALSVLNRKMEEANIVGHGTNNIPANEAAPWIYV